MSRVFVNDAEARSRALGGDRGASLSSKFSRSPFIVSRGQTRRRSARGELERNFGSSARRKDVARSEEIELNR